MFDTVLGLPVHALVVHAAVVLVPLMALLTVLVAARPSWRARFAWPVVAGNALATVAVFVAKQSGEALQRRIGSTPAIDRHAQLGSTMVGFSLALLVASLLLAIVRRRPGLPSRAAGLVCLVAAAAATVWLARTGHSGADAVWGQIVRSTNP